MRRPTVEPENFEAVYDYYRQLTPDTATRFAVQTFAIDRYRNATLHFEDGSRSAINQLAEEDSVFLLLSNHQYAVDQWATLGAFAADPVMLKTLNPTFIWAKRDYFHLPWPRPMLDAVGGVPAFRPHKDFDHIPEHNRAALTLETTKALLSTTAFKMVEHSQNAFLYGEGTRNPDKHVIGKVFGGAGRLLEMVARERQVAVIFIGQWLEKQSDRQPDLFIAKPHLGPFTEPKATTRVIRDRLQYCVDEAYSRRVRRLSQLAVQAEGPYSIRDASLTQATS